VPRLAESERVHTQHSLHSSRQLETPCTAPPAPYIDHMQRGSPALATVAGLVRRRFDTAIEADLLKAVEAWQDGGPPQRQCTDDPHSIVLGSQLVVTLAARLRAAPWAAMFGDRPGSASPVPGTHAALLLLSSLFR